MANIYVVTDSPWFDRDARYPGELTVLHNWCIANAAENEDNLHTYSSITGQVVVVTEYGRRRQ